MGHIQTPARTDRVEKRKEKRIRLLRKINFKSNKITKKNFNFIIIIIIKFVFESIKSILSA